MERFLSSMISSKAIHFILVMCCPLLSISQEKDSVAKLEISSFSELYYGYDFDDNTSGSRFPFLFSHNRKNQVAVNLAMAKAAFESGRFRANLALQQGTYPQDNYRAEPKALRWIHEANFGYALNAEKTVWLDAGVMPPILVLKVRSPPRT